MYNLYTGLYAESTNRLIRLLLEKITRHRGAPNASIRRWCHGDLKATNVFIDEMAANIAGTVTSIGGLCTKKQKTKTAQICITTLRYIPRLDTASCTGYDNVQNKQNTL